MAVTLPILTFHDIDDRSSAVSFSPGLFHRSMRRLTEEGYTTISLSRIVECIRKAVPFPDNGLCITFDDGYRSVYERAFPLLREHGMTATVFLTVGCSRSQSPERRLPSFDGRQMLSWREIREMHSRGIEFGAHTRTHQDLTRLRSKRLDAEIRDAKGMIEDVLGSAVTAFAYPFGYHNARIRETVREYYNCACSARLALTRGTSDPFALERIDMYYFRTERMFRIMMSGCFPLYIQLRNMPRQVRSLVRRGKWL